MVDRVWWTRCGRQDVVDRVCMVGWVRLGLVSVVSYILGHRAKVYEIKQCGRILMYVHFVLHRWLKKRDHYVQGTPGEAAD